MKLEDLNFDSRWEKCFFSGKFPWNRDGKGILIELKYGENDEKLDSLAMEAYQQIQKKNYKSDLENRVVRDIIPIGIGFSGKNVVVKC